MKSEEIEVIIDRDGEVQIRVRGVKGKSCLALTQALEEQLGGKVDKRSLTSDYYDEGTVRQSENLVRRLRAE